MAETLSSNSTRSTMSVSSASPDRPLDMIRRHERKANRSSARAAAASTRACDVIDNLGAVSGPDGGLGAAWHHDGPYDATLAARNTVPQYSPVAAVRQSNEEALRATPREFVADSLRRHVPLQGTASVPPGEPDMSGNLMQYREGADLMREPDAPGGPYKRYQHVTYHPDDLKGKGEPSFSIEKREKEAKKLRRRSRAVSAGAASYEMQPASSVSSLGAAAKQPGFRVRTSAVPSSTVPGAPLSPPLSPDAGALSPRPTINDGGLQRRNTTGKRLADGIRRRLSLRKKHTNAAENDDDDELV